MKTDKQEALCKNRKHSEKHTNIQCVHKKRKGEEDSIKMKEYRREGSNT